MKKILSFFAAMLVAVAANATIRNITPTHCFEGDRSDGYTLYVELERGAQAGDTIVLADGEYIEPLSFSINVPVVIMATENAHPVVKQSGYFKVHASAEFKGIKFQFVGDAGNGYFAYFYENTQKFLKLDGCEFQDFTQYCVSSWEAYHIDSCIVNDCYFHDLAKGPFYFAASSLENNVNACDKLKVTNSTFANINVVGWVSVLDIRNNENNVSGASAVLDVDHCTFYNCQGDYERLVQNYKSSLSTVRNCIFMNPIVEGKTEIYATYLYGGSVHHNLNYQTKRQYVSGGTVTDSICSNPLFVNAAEGNYTLGEGSPALTAAEDGGALGDPRWWPAAEPVEARTLYLQPNADWKSDGARFAICILSNPQEWVDMTAVDGADGYYSAEITTNNQVIFCRMNGATTENNWQNKWNQTQDMTLDEENDMCVISGWDNAGAWSKYVAPAVPDIAWELNGGAMNPKGLASKEALWYQFVADFNACYNKNKELSFEGLTPVTANGLTYNIGIDNLLTETWGWKWLLDYVTDVTTAAIAAGQEYAAGKPVAAMSTEAMRRATVASFWASGQYTSWPGSADFSEAGKPENYLLAYRAMMMPESVDAEFTLVNPTKKGYTFAGWFNNAEFSGEALTSIPANFQGKLYAKWTALPAQQFYLKPGPWYYAANGEKFAMYAFEDGMPEYWSAFMSLAENETSIYTGTIPGGYTHVIFVRFGSASTNPSWSDNMWNQSEDLTIEADKDMYTITNQEPWSQETGSHKAEGAWSKYEYVAPAKFYILGTNGWEPETDLIRSDEDSYVLHLVAGYYEIKVLVDGTWATSKGYDDLTEVAAGLSKNEEFGNICFTLDADGDVTVTYTGEVFKLEGSFHVSGTAIDNAAVEAKVVKMIENGQIVIIRNGEKFNVQGQVIR